MRSKSGGTLRATPSPARRSGETKTSVRSLNMGEKIIIIQTFSCLASRIHCEVSSIPT